MHRIEDETIRNKCVKGGFMQWQLFTPCFPGKT